MASKDWSNQLSHVNFRCGACRCAWSALPDLIEEAPSAEHHPWRYFAHCPDCKAEHQPQASWERALLKAHQVATGPTTPAGKAASAANLDGHPTPEETLRTRFNAMKHGISARTARYFPARPDRYPFCGQCDVNRAWCAEQPACVKQTEIFMLHHAAFEQRNPKVLSHLHADLQAGLTAALQMCLQAVLGEGVLIKQPRVELDREGTPTTLTYIGPDGKSHYIYDYQSNPGFKPIADLVSRLGLSMSDLGLTVRAAEDKDDEGLGMLSLDAASKETLKAFGDRMAAATLVEQLEAVQAEAQRAHEALETMRRMLAACDPGQPVSAGRLVALLEPICASMDMQSHDLAMLARKAARDRP